MADKKIIGNCKVSNNLSTRSVQYDTYVVPTSNSNLLVDFASTSYFVFTGSIVGQIITLGDATTYKPGHLYTIYNESSTEITINDYNNNELYILKPTFRIQFVLQDNSSSSGIWIRAVNSSSGAAAISNPGYAWGSGGNVSSGGWLINNDVSSNKVGIPFGSTGGKLLEIWSGSEDLNTYSITIFQHDGGLLNLTSLVTVNVINSSFEKFKVADFGDVDVEPDRQVAVQISSGSAKNPQVFCIFLGDI